MKKRAQIIPADTVASRIQTIRGQKVIIDASLAEIYGVQTKELNRAVKRNARRFPIRDRLGYAGSMQLQWVERGLWTRFLLCGSSEPVQRPGSTFQSAVL